MPVKLNIQAARFYVLTQLFAKPCTISAEIIDPTEHLILQKAHNQTINNISTKVTDGGFKPRFAVMGGLGWHF